MKTKLLKKELTLLNVYTLATGTTLSAGFFLLPGLAFHQAGPAMILSYMIATLPLIPAMFSMVELATAMPRAGGAYYFLDRSMGPWIGTIGGLGTWLALVFKTAFALIGMGAYIRIFLPELPVLPIAAACALLFAFINVVGAKKSGGLQVILVFILLVILGLFLGVGSFQMNFTHFEGFFEKGSSSIFSTAGLVYISYVGVTKIASVAEEIKDPGRNLPLGVFLAIGTSIFVYALGTTIMVGVIPAEELMNDLTPAASAAMIIGGKWGAFLMTCAAIAAFSSVVNAGILSASRYPLAMSRDHLVPKFFLSLGKRGTPVNGIIVTVLLILLLIVFFDISKIAKLASGFQLLVFSLICLAVIVMRESHIESYDPPYRSPLYPWMQIFGILSPLWLIAQMGVLPMLFTLAIILAGSLWFFYYGKERVVRSGAIFHLFARLGEERFEGLETELRGIMKEKGVREEDPFDQVVTRAQVIDCFEARTFEELVVEASQLLSQVLPVSKDELQKDFLEGRIGSTPIAHGAALPHTRIQNIEQAEMVIVRSHLGSFVATEQVPGHDASGTQIYAFFFFVSPSSNPGQHLRILAQIAGRIDDPHFMEEWKSAKNDQALKETVLRDERFISLKLALHTPSAALIAQALKDVRMPEGSLVALVRRQGETVIPHGNTVLHEGDRLTIVGTHEGIRELHEKYEI